MHIYILKRGILQMEKFEKIKSPLIGFDEIYYNNINDNPKIITEMYYHPDYFTLANGILPWIILMRNRQLNEKGNYELEIHELLKGRINRKVINQIDNPGLFSGIAGILYTLSISANDKRYDNLIQGILPYLEKKTYNKIKQCYINKIKKKVNDYDYDLISGLSGILKCYINSSVRKYIHNSEIIHETARCLQSYFNYNDFKNIEDLPYYIKKEKNKYMPTKNGLINFSHSHGIMGILNALNQYYEIFEKKETKRVIEKICEFVINFYSESSYSWLKKFYSDNKKIYDSPNYTWCYGDLIMTQTFYKSAKHIENKSYISISNNFFDNLKDKYELLPSPSLCHGKSGVLLQLLNFKQTNMSELSDIYFEKLMDDYDDNNIYKFRDCEEYRGRRYYIDKNNFLTGSLGIYFVIDLYFGLKDHVKLSDLIM